MRIDLARAASVAGLAAALAACTTDGFVNTSARDNWGEANRQTMAAQVIDPAPQYDTAIPPTHAQHAAQAVDRYRTDKVKKPERVKTSTIGSSGTN